MSAEGAVLQAEGMQNERKRVAVAMRERGRCGTAQSFHHMSLWVSTYGTKYKKEET